MAPYDDIPTITESEYNAQMGEGDDIPTITESEYNSMNSSSMLGGNSASISNDEEPSYFDRARQLITDNLFGAPDTEVSWDDLDRARNPKPQVPTVADMFSSGVDQLRAYPATVASGLASASNIPGVRDVGSNLLAMSKPTRRQDLEVFEQIPEDSISSYVAPTALGLGKMGGLMLTGMGPLGLAAGMGLSSIGEKEAQMEDMGLSRQAAAPAAMISGVANALLSSPLFATARSGLNPLLKSGLGALEGYAQNSLGTLADIYGTYQSTGEAPSFDKAIASMNKSGKIGMAIGGIVAPLGGKPQTETKVDTDGLVKYEPEVSTQADTFISNEAPMLQPQSDTGSLSLPDMTPELPVQKTVVPSNPVDVVKEMGSKEFPDIQKLAKQSAATVEEAPAPQLTQVEVSPVVKGVPTYEVPLSEIYLSQDVPNFKRGANEKGVVEPLSGKYERLGTPPIVVWERLNGRKEVITGRHKLDLAQRTGESTIPTQIVREADGFNSDMAKIFDAESNIRDEKGSVLDYATYFKNTGLGEGEAEARGLLSRSKGVQGFDIGTKATTEVYSLHANGEISDAKAAAIARAAPNDAGLQRAGLAFAKKGLNAQQIYNAILATAELEKKLPDGTSKWKEWQDVNLFEDTDRAMKLGEDAGIIAEQFQKEIGLEIQATQGAAKNPEKARAKGVSIKNPEAILEGNKKLALERQRWANWAKYPDLFKKVMDKVKGESGQTRLISDIANAAGDVAQGVKNFVKKGTPYDDIEATNPAQHYFEGGRLKYVNRTAAKALGGFRKQMMSLVSQMDKDPRIAEAVTGARRANEAMNQVGFDSGEILQPFMSLKGASKNKVNSLIIETGRLASEAAKRGEKLSKITDDQLLAKGWKPEEVSGYRAFREYTDFALDKFREAQITKAEDSLHPAQLQEFITELDTYVEGLKGMHYFPRNRYGDRAYVVGKDKSGKFYREHFDSLRAAKKRRQEMIQKGFTDVQAKETPKIDYDAAIDVPPGMLPEAGTIDPVKFKNLKEQGADIRGWGRHLLKAHDVEGFTTDLQQSISDYAMGLSNYYSKNLLKKTRKSVMSQMTNEDQVLSAKLNDYFNFQLKPSEASLLARTAHVMYIAGVPIHLLVNQTATGMFVLPEAVRSFGSAYNPLNHAKGVNATMTGMAQGLEYILPGKRLGITSLKGELGDYIKTFERDGLLDPKYVHEMGSYAKGLNGKKPLDEHLSIFMKVGEEWQRASAAITAYHAGKMRGLKGDVLTNFGKEFFYKTVPDHTKVDRPPFAYNSTIGKSFMMYKSYVGHMLRLLRSYSHPKLWPLLTYTLGTAVAASGIFGPPAGKETKKVLSSYGINPEPNIRKMFPEDADKILYGLGSDKLNFGASASTQEFLAEVDKDPFGAVTSALGGPYVDMAKRAVKGVRYAREGKYKSAFNTVAPRMIRNMSKATEILATGKLTDAGGFTPIQNGDWKDALSILAGAPPLEMSKAYEEKNVYYDIKQQDRNLRKDYKQKAMKAYKAGDMKGMLKVVQAAAKEGIRVSLDDESTDAFSDAAEGASKRAKLKMLEVKGLYER